MGGWWRPGAPESATPQQLITHQPCVPVTLPVLISIQVGLPQTLTGDDEAGPWARPWTTGFHKHPVAGPVRLGFTNLADDSQADLENHGGRDKAVNAYPAEHYSFWRERLRLPDMPHGWFGENFTVVGLDETIVCVGDVYRIGSAVVQVSQPRQPCWKLARRWRLKDLVAHVVESGRTGWYFRVLAEGVVASGMTLECLERPHPQWTISAANEVMHHRKQELAAAAALAGCEFLSESWREYLTQRSFSVLEL